MKRSLWESSFGRIAIISFATLIIAVSITAGIALNVFSKALDEKQHVIEHQAAMKLSSYVYEKYSRINDLLNNNNTRTLIGKRFDEIESMPEKAYEYSNIESFLTLGETVCASDPDFRDCILISSTGVVYSQTAMPYGDAIASYDFLNDSIFSVFKNSHKTFDLILDNSSRYTIVNSGNVISMLWKIYSPRSLPNMEFVGLMIVNIPEDAFTNAFRDFSGVMRGNLQVLNSSGEQVYIFKENASEKEAISAIDYPVGIAGIHVYSLLPKNLIHEEQTSLLQSALFVIILVAAFSMFVIGLVAFSYNRRSRQMIEYMHRVQNGRLDEHIPIKRRDEIGILGEAFNNMADKLDSHIKRTYRAELAMRDSEIALLQSQINPHFLYNSLENMSMLASSGGNEDLADLAADLGQFFRISIRSKDRIVRIENELEYIRLYMNIHAARFGDRLQFEIDAQPELLTCAIPKLILQPLVENSIIHGHRMLKDGAFVRVSISRADNPGEIRICVNDNGEGMTSQRISEVMQSQKSIGLPNVAQRISLMFGESRALQIESTFGEGTQISFLLPEMSVEEMKEYVQAADR